MIKRLATDIRQISYWQSLYISGYILMVLVVVGMMPLPWWAVATILIISVVACLLSIRQSIQPIHITAPDPTNMMTRWQLLYAGYDSDDTDSNDNVELWEANLSNIKSYGNCMQLVFDTVHPIERQQYVIIWQDQVDNEAWRQLKVLARWA